jgi:lysozyme
MPILGLDISHYQGTPNFAQLKASGREFVVIKATEGTGYVDPMMARNRDAAHAAGMVVGLYHFARAGNVDAEVHQFLSAVGTLRANEFLVLDWEVPAPAGGAPAWCKAWLDSVHGVTGVAPLIYMNQSTMNGSNWSSVAPTYGLWLAKYDQSTAQVPTNWWPVEAMKQDNDRSLITGVVGGVDDDVFYGTVAQLVAYGTPTGGNPNMTLTPADLQAIKQAIWQDAGDAGFGPVWIADRIIASNKDDDEIVVLARSINAKLDNLARAVAAGPPPIDVDALAAKIQAATTTDEAKQIASEVVAEIGQRMNTP